MRCPAETSVPHWFLPLPRFWEMKFLNTIASRFQVEINNIHRSFLNVEVFFSFRSSRHYVCSLASSHSRVWRCGLIPQVLMWQHVAHTQPPLRLGSSPGRGAAPGRLSPALGALYRPRPGLTCPCGEVWDSLRKVKLRPYVWKVPESGGSPLSFPP